MRRRNVRWLVPYALMLLLVLAQPAGASNNGRGFYGGTNDHAVTSTGFILIAFFPIFVIVMSTLQRHLERRKEQRKAAEKALQGKAQWRGGW